jgi:CubicO group peptidase (beta-lactamase class C family)
VIDGNDVEVEVREGADQIGPGTRWEIGSITKTFTGTALAALVVDGTVTLETTVGSILGMAEAGGFADRTLVQLATHRSGAARLHPGAWKSLFSRQPYARMDESAMLGSLRRAKVGAPGKERYSNYGFMLLALTLARAAGTDPITLLRSRVLDPLGLKGRIGEESIDDGETLPGYTGTTALERWINATPGAGGIDLTIEDLRRWVFANIAPTTTPLAEAITLAQQPHADAPRQGLGWAFGAKAGLWHNGAQAGCYAMISFDPRIGFGVGIVLNTIRTSGTEKLIVAVINDLHRARSPNLG